jgi:hypothetical protein
MAREIRRWINWKNKVPSLPDTVEGRNFNLNEVIMNNNDLNEFFDLPKIKIGCQGKRYSPDILHLKKKKI